MVFSRYLYSKVNETTQDFISIWLDSNDIDFLNKNNIEYSKLENHMYLVNCSQIKQKFYAS